MIYATLADIKDEFMKNIVMQDDLDEAQEYIDELARTLDVDPSKIVTPTPVLIRRLAVAYACMVRARYKSGSNPKNYQMTDGADAYELKRRDYGQEVDKLTKQITSVVLLGGPQKKTMFPVIKMYRG